MNDPRPAFPFYPADFWGSDAVALMDLEAAGLYLFCLSREWQEGSLTADERVLKRLTAGRVRDWDASWAQVRPMFEERDGRLFNKRLEEERGVADEVSSRQSERAKARWERFRAGKNATAVPRHSHGSATAMPPQCLGSEGIGSDLNGTDRNGSDRKGPSARKARNKPEPKPRADSLLVSDYWCARFLKVRGAAYVWAGGKDGGHLQALLTSTNGDVAEIQRRIDRFLADPFWGPKADWQKFCSQYNSMAGNGQTQSNVLDVILGRS